MNLSQNFETQLKEILNRNLNKPDGITPSNLAESIQYSLLSSGKRIRPRLLLATGKMLDLSADSLLHSAVSLEMIHCFTLIHDDLPCMDNDDFRRGLPTNHKKFGEAIALLAGDALIPVAIEVFLESPAPTDRLIAGLKRLTWAMGPRGVIGGQAAESQLSQHSNLKDLEQMHRQKTGALFSAAILIPKEFAGISDNEPKGKALISFADQLGLAFQLADDLEDAGETTKDGSSKNEALLPTSVLYYQSAEEAKTAMITSLKRVTQSLSENWKEKAQPLLEISNEVVDKIETAAISLKRK